MVVCTVLYFIDVKKKKIGSNNGKIKFIKIRRSPGIFRFLGRIRRPRAVEIDCMYIGLAIDDVEKSTRSIFVSFLPPLPAFFDANSVYGFMEKRKFSVSNTSRVVCYSTENARGIRRDTALAKRKRIERLRTSRT